MPPLNKLQKTGLVLAMSQSFSAQAANIFVDNAGDDGEGCTFREAVISLTNAALEPGCRQAVSAFGTRDSIRFQVPSVTLKSEVVIEKDLAINPFTIDPPVVINGDGSDRLLSIRNSTVSINKTTLSGGRTSDDGGGILVGNGATLSLTNSTVSDNQANDYGGGIFATNTTKLTMVNSTVSNNVAFYGGGGGLNLFSCDTQIANSTISNNISDGSGGGIYLPDAPTCSATIVNSTITQNVSTNSAGGGLDTFGTQIFLYKNLIVGNQAADAAFSEAFMANQSLPNSAVRQNVIGSSYYHSLTLSDNNIIVDANTAANTLALLADNGGPTLTHALPAGSPAINAGDSEVCAAEPINNLDQRGEPRDEQCFIGAVEFIEPEDGTFFVVPTKNGKSVIVEL